MSAMEASPSSWSVPRLSAWLAQDERLDPEAIDALALCDVDGRMFLEMDEEDLAESDELGLDMKAMHAILQLQEKLEALELAHNGEERPNSESSVHASGMFPTSLTVVTGAAAAAASTAPSQGAASTGDSQCSSFWWLPCVSVDEQGNSFFSEKKVGLRAGTASGIGALSELIPSTGLKFRETPGDYDFDFHTAPAKQFIVSLDAGVEIEVTDGTRRIFPAGTVMLLEDTWGKGHRSRAVDRKPRKSLFVLLPDNFKL